MGAPPSHVERAGRGPDPVVAAATLVALATRLARLDRAPLWFDETYTASWVRLPLGACLREALEANHLPLSFLLLDAWTALVGDSAWALRLPGVVASVATVPAVAAIARFAAGREAGRRSAWLLALLPFAIHHAQEARMYGPVAFLAAGTTLAVLRSLDPVGAAPSVLLAASGTALAATHYYGAVFVAACVAILLASPEARRRVGRSLAVLVASVAIAGLLALRFGKPQEAGASYDLGLSLLPGLAWAMVGGCTLVPQPAAAHALGALAALPYLPIAVPGLLAAAVLVAGARRVARPRDWATLVSLATAALAIPIVASLLVGGGTSPRYASPGLPAAVALLGAGASFSRAHRARLAATLVVAACAVLGSSLHLAHPGHGREAVDAAGTWLDEHAAPDVPVVVSSEEMATLARFHWPRRPVVDYPPRGVVAGPANAEALAAGLPFPRGDRVFFVLGRDWISDPRGHLRSALAARWSSCGGVEVEGIRVFCLERGRGDPGADGSASPG